MKMCRTIIQAACAAAVLIAVSAPSDAGAASCGKTITADVVAIDQAIMFNRLGAVNPIGEMFALRHDVVDKDTGLPEGATAPDGSPVTLQPGKVRLRDDKRPRPIALRVNEGDCLQISFQNLLNPVPLEVLNFDDQPATRSAGITVQGMSFVNSIADGGAYVGTNVNGLAAPGEQKTYTLRGEREGGYVLISQSDVVSGEGGQGQTSFGLFGVVNVEKKGAEWYRNNATNQELAWASTKPDGSRNLTPDGHPIIDYNAVYPVGHPFAGKPILKILDGNRIFHNELNAIITGPNHGDFPAGTWPKNPAYPNRDKAFREFTVIFHDEVQTVQPFPIFTDPSFDYTLGPVKDGFMINYASAAVGTETVANRLGVGPTWDCPECKLEEFFLTSWAVSDPGILVDVPANTTDGAGALITGPKATKALYPDDPSNVFHAYMGDRTKIRNLHVGKEYHIFHLHAQQWLFTPDDDGSNYLDAQGLGPGSSYTYEMAYNSGNRNKEMGDAIFHCHFYPHFAQGMWALYRIHDVFEEGTTLDPDGSPAAGARALPDGEITEGTPIPAVIPIPTNAMAPMPGKVHIGAVPGFSGGQIIYDEPTKNAGYPFNLGMKAGHRPATPPLDIVDDGGLPRHIVRGGGTVHSVVTPLDLSKELLTADAEFLPETGNQAERAGMAFHAKASHPTFLPNGTPSVFRTNGLPPAPGAPFADPCRSDSGARTGVPRIYKGVNIQFDMKHNKLGQHFPQSRIITLWGDAQSTVDGTKPPEPFFIRANTNDCVSFYHTNLVPSVYEQDDFQVRTPTDIIGQHIHLVKFDVTSSDGSANGFNYEDGTMSPDEVRERIHAFNATGGLIMPDGSRQNLTAKPHPFFGSTFNGRDITGARTTIQRWYVDNLLNLKGEDRTLGNVFTHDHFGPSTHQQTGLYATLLTEPQGSRWRNPETGQFYGGRFDGGPTSWRADILTANPANSHREYMFQVQDFTLAYEPGGGGDALNPHPDPAKAINPPGREEVGLPFLYRKPQVCPNGTAPPCPTAISTHDDGGWSVNYRNEPIAERLRNPNTNLAAAGQAGDPAFAFSSRITRENPLLNVQPSFYPPLTAGVGPKDPFTPLVRVYEKDKVRFRIQNGATEESSNATIHGVKWLQEYASPNSGWRNAQHLGISEQFFLNMPVVQDRRQVGPVADYLYALSTAEDALWSGTWGIMRSYATKQPDLLPLPNNPVGSTEFTASNEIDFSGVCPKTAPVRKYDVTAVLASNALPGGTLTYNSRTANNGPLQDPDGIVWVRTGDLDGAGKLKAGVPVEPLVLRAAAGDCIDITMRNKLPSVVPESPAFNGLPMIVDDFNYNQIQTSSNVGLHPQLVEYDITRADGVNVGMNPTQTVAPGQVKNVRWYAGDISIVGTKRVATPIEFGAVGLLPADKIKQAGKGALGALVIEPKGATWVEDYPAPAPRVPSDQRPSRTSATVRTPDGKEFREQVLVFQDGIPMRTGDGAPVPFTVGQEDSEDSGMKALNYRTEPLWFRMGFAPDTTPQVTRDLDFTASLANATVGGDPQTPIFTTRAGDAIRLRIVSPAGHARNHVFALQGHVWQRTPYVLNSTKIGNNPKSFWRGSQDQIGPAEHFDIIPEFGAGGPFAVTGDYLYRDMLPLHFMNGLWGIMRVE